MQNKAYLRAAEVVVRKKNKTDSQYNNALRLRIVQWLHDQAFYVQQHWNAMSNTTRMTFWRDDQK